MKVAASPPRDPASHLELMLYVDGEVLPDRADEIEAQLHADPEARAVVEGLRLAARVLSADVLERADRESPSIADRVMDQIDRPGKGRRRRPAWNVAAPLGIALSAAALWLFWFARPAAIERGATLGSSSVGAGTEAMLGAEAEDSVESTTEVEAVDFGSRAGTIFYVPSAGGAITTAVVWLTDDQIGVEDPPRMPSEEGIP